MTSINIRASQQGFTLIEIIVGLVISSMILVSLNLVMGAVNRGFDATSQAIGRQVELTRAFQILSGDISRIERYRATVDGAGQYQFEGTPAEMVFPLVERPGNNVAGTYWVKVLVRSGASGTELVRSRKPLVIGATSPDSSGWSDDVVLVRAPVGIEFAYRAPRTGIRNWSSSWHGGAQLPEQIRVVVVDTATGRLRVPHFVQYLKLDADPACDGSKGVGCEPTETGDGP